MNLRKVEKVGKKYPFVFYGVPFMVFMVGGSFMLTSWTQIRYDRHDSRQKMLSRKEEKVIEKEEVVEKIKSEYKSLLDEAGQQGEHWQQKRISRPESWGIK